MFMALAATGQTYMVDQFDSNTTALWVNQAWGLAVPAITWSTNNAATTLAANNPGSGSSRWVVPWTTNNDQIEVTRMFNGGSVLDLSNYSSVSFDIMYASNSATDGAGSYGSVEVNCVPQSDGWPSTYLSSYTSTIANSSRLLQASFCHKAERTRAKSRVWQGPNPQASLFLPLNHQTRGTPVG